MQNKIYVLPGVIALIALGVIFIFIQKGAPQAKPNDRVPAGSDPANTIYLIEGEPVLLTGGVSEIAIAADSSSTVRTAIFDKPVIGDLDGDGDKDMALLLTRDTGGSGAFYYLVAALQNLDKTAQGTNAIFVGDRIAPQNIQITDGVIVLNYADRKPGEPMSTQPSVGVSLYAGIKNGELVRTTAPKS